MAPQKDCFPRCNYLLNFYDENIIQKSSAWFILNRTICKKIIYMDIDNINEKYGNLYVAEEHFYITLIYRHNLKII